MFTSGGARGTDPGGGVKLVGLLPRAVIGRAPAVARKLREMRDAPPVVGVFERTRDVAVTDVPLVEDTRTVRDKECRRQQAPEQQLHERAQLLHLADVPAKPTYPTRLASWQGKG